MWAEKNNRAIKFLTARPNGILRGGVGSGIYLALLFGIRKMRGSMFVASGKPQRAPQGVLGDGVGSVNRRRPLKPLEGRPG